MGSLERHERAMVSALHDAGYPEPVKIYEPGRVRLQWGTSSEEPSTFDLSEDGSVLVFVDHAPDAEFRLSEGTETARTWLGLLWPLIAEKIANVTDSAVVAEPAAAVKSPAAFAYLDDSAEQVWAVYTDRSRIWAGEGSPSDVGDALLGTPRGFQLGITLETAIGVGAGGTRLVNPAIVTPSAVQDGDQWMPAFKVEYLSGPPDVLAATETMPLLSAQAEAEAQARDEIDRSAQGQAADGHFLGEVPKRWYRRMGF